MALFDSIASSWHNFRQIMATAVEHIDCKIFASDCIKSCLIMCYSYVRLAAGSSTEGEPPS